MTVLLLRLAAPMQSWGDSSRFVRRGTRQQPTKSGVLGLLAAAQGRRRTDPIEDLLALRFGVRVDQPGQLMKDFQTARSLDERKTMPLSYRYYISDAVFLAGLEGEPTLLQGVIESLRRPTFPLYLGRRSCPPTPPLFLGIRDGILTQVLADEPWHASRSHQRATPSEVVRLDIHRDAAPGEVGEVARDEPISFDPRRREYGWRTVVTTESTTVRNPSYRVPVGDQAQAPAHEPMNLLNGG